MRSRASFAPHGPCRARARRRRSRGAHFDVVINATSAGLDAATSRAAVAATTASRRTPSPTTWSTPTRRRRSCAGRAAHGAARTRGRPRHADRAGRGKLLLWRGVRPDTARGVRAAAPAARVIAARERARAGWWIARLVAGRCCAAFVLRAGLVRGAHRLVARPPAAARPRSWRSAWTSCARSDPQATLHYTWVPYERISHEPEARDDRRRGREVRRARGLRLGRHPARAREEPAARAASSPAARRSPSSSRRTCSCRRRGATCARPRRR